MAVVQQICHPKGKFDQSEIAPEFTYGFIDTYGSLGMPAHCFSNCCGAFEYNNEKIVKKPSHCKIHDVVSVAVQYTHCLIGIGPNSLKRKN
jgi:hypothetical protein